MINNDEEVNKLEQLLESLIKMVGRANQNTANLQKQIQQMNENIDSLQMRINQLEWVMKVQREDMLIHPIRIYPTPTPAQDTSEIHEKIPFRV